METFLSKGMCVCPCESNKLLKMSRSVSDSDLLCAQSTVRGPWSFMSDSQTDQS
jgi:hypothetical protein